MRVPIKIYAYCLFLVMSLMINSTSMSQKSSNPPQTILLPWQNIQMPPTIKGESKKALDESLQNLANTLLQNPISLQGYLQGQQPPLNLSANMIKRTAAIQASGTTLNGFPGYTIIEPQICSLADHYLFFLNVKDLATGLLLSSNHVAVSKEQYHQQLQANTLNDLLINVIRELNTGINFRQGDPNNTLKISFSLGRETTGTEKGSSHCINLLLEENLITNYKVAGSTNNEMLFTLKRIFDTPIGSMRSNRKIVNIWSFPMQETHTFPLTLELNSTYAEAVFGKKISPRMTSIYTLSRNNNQIRLIPDRNLEEFLNQESQVLNLTDNPKVAKIYRAWVYVDKGRAWGLKMNDRLVTQVGQVKIKGHVVGFFGPEEGLTSPQTNLPINEGAIIYIRKGQGQTTLGQEFVFDPQQYP